MASSTLAPWAGAVACNERFTIQYLHIVTPLFLSLDRILKVSRTTGCCAAWVCSQLQRSFSISYERGQGGDIPLTDFFQSKRALFVKFLDFGGQVDRFPVNFVNFSPIVSRSIGANVGLFAFRNASNNFAERRPRGTSVATLPLRSTQLV